MFDFIKREVRAYPELDTIRFISVTLVVCHHLFFQNGMFLSWAHDYAWVGVDIFFTLSGFLITGILIKEIEKNGKIDFKNFILKRIIRLWPCWLIALLLSFSLTYAFASKNLDIMHDLKTKFIYYILHFGNYSHAFSGKLHTLFSHFWSLAVEEHFYLIWPATMAIVYKFKGLKKTVLFSLVLLPYLFRVMHHYLGWDQASITLSTHTRIDSIVWGCILAFVFNKIKDLTTLQEVFQTILMFALFFISLHYIARNEAISPWISELGRTTLAWSTCLLIIISLKGSKKGLRRVLSNPILSWLGIMSYGVYLFHVHTNVVLFALVKKYAPTMNETSIALLSNILPYGPAIITFYLIDKKLNGKRSAIIAKIRGV